MKIFYKIIFVLILLYTENSFCQVPDWAWAKSANGNYAAMGQAAASDAWGNAYISGMAGQGMTFDTIAMHESGMFLVKYDGNGNVIWLKEVDGDVVVRSITIDATGNIYVAGDFTGAYIVCGSDTLYNYINANNTCYYNIFLIKYDSNGNTLWSKGIDGTYSDNVLSVTTDVAGNVYITGHFASPTITFGTVTLNHPGMFVVKYDESGNVLWAKDALGTSHCYVTTDVLGNAYVSGFFFGSAAFDSITINSIGSFDLFLVKYDSNGNVLWAKSEGGSAWDRPYSVTTDGSGNILVAGWFASSSITFGSTTLFNVGGWDMFIAKFDASGNELWAKSAGSNYNDFASSVTTDAFDNVLVTGLFSILPITFGSTTLSNAGMADIFIVKYDASGNELWAKSVGGNDADYAWSITTDVSDNVLVAGSFYSASVTFGSTSLGNAGGWNMFLSKLNGVTGINEQNENLNFVTISPNPFTTTLTIKGTTQKGELIIFDITGKEILRKKIFNAETEINTAHLTPGFYFINYGKENKKVNKKVVKF